MFGFGLGTLVSGLGLLLVGWLTKRHAKKEMEHPLSDSDLSALEGCMAWFMSLGFLASGGVLSVIGAILIAIAKIFLGQ